MIGTWQEKPTDQPHLHRRAQQFVGKTYVVAVTIENGNGKVRIGDILWQVEGPDAVEGARVKVTAADGNTLIVEPPKG